MGSLVDIPESWLPAGDNVELVLGQFESSMSSDGQLDRPLLCSLQKNRKIYNYNLQLVMTDDSVI
jgi:hypothetical protein